MAAAAVALREGGIEAVTIAGVAARAGTTRPAVYRRFATQEELVIAALGSFANETRAAKTGVHYKDLEAELRSFRDGITRAHSITLVGSMLRDDVAPEVQRAYREAIVRPRRERISGILEAARRDGELPCSKAEIEVATTMSTGSFYAYALAGRPTRRDWPRTTAALIWRALGGTPA